MRDWVLALSMDQQVDQTLSVRNCDKCRTSIYEASLICHKCSNQSPPCIVSGACVSYPPAVTAIAAPCRCTGFNVCLMRPAAPWLNDGMPSVAHRLPCPSSTTCELHELWICCSQAVLERVCGQGEVMSLVPCASNAGLLKCMLRLP